MSIVISCDVLRTVFYIVVLSANKTIFYSRDNSREVLMQIRKKNEHWAEPYGTPRVNE